MTELAALNVRITGDATDLSAAVTRATGDLGKVSAAARGVTSSAAQSSVALSNLGHAAGGAGVGVQQFGWQFSQMGQSIAAGTPPLNAFTMQLGDLLPMLGIGGLAGLAVTAAAVLVPLAGAFLTNADNASELTDGIKELTEATNAFKISADAIRFGVDEEEVVLVREINRLQEERNRLNAEWQATDSLGARQRIAEEASAIKSQIAPLQAQLKAYRDARDEAARLKSEVDNVTTAADSAARAVANIGASASAAIWNVSALGKAMWDVAAAAAARASAEQRLSEMAMQNSPGGQALMKYGGRGGGDGGLSTKYDMFGNPITRGGGGGGSSGGGGSGGGENPIIGELEALQESLMTQEEAQLASFTRQQETMKAALDQRLITQQEYNAMMEAAQMQHSEAMAEIDAYRYGDGALQFQTFMGDMANALQSGNDRMQRIGRIFGAVEALTNAWRAYNQTLADPTLPFYAKFAAAASVLSAGMGAVNAIKGGGGGGGRGGASAAAAGPSQMPMQVQLNTYGSGDFIRGADFGLILDRLNSEAGDRGYNLMWRPT